MEVMTGIHQNIFHVIITLSQQPLGVCTDIVIGKIYSVFTTCHDWLVVLRIYVALAVFQSYRDLEAGDNQTLKFKWRGGESNPGPLAPQAKSLTTRPPPLPYMSRRRKWAHYNKNALYMSTKEFKYNILYFIQLMCTY